MAWLPLVPIAVANGALREFFLKDLLGELPARQLSTILLLVFFALYIGFVLRAWPLASSRQAAAVGVLWLVLTLAFEFGLGHFVSHLTWRDMLADYDLRAGRIWILVPLWVAVAPYLFYRWRRA